ncbi:MAG: aminomethyl-transferring glycine dehydrogenase subunit GcvPA [Armatimonadota bacterium]
MAYLPNTSDSRRAMLHALGVEHARSLLEQQIPEPLRLKEELKLPPPLSEMELVAELEADAAVNTAAGQTACFLGAGVYDHFIPAAVGHLVGRAEFYTSYTPYQAEASQGILQATFEYQSLVCALTGMDVSNASNYDGATALAEAAIMCQAATGKSTVLVSEAVHPSARRVLQTYTAGLGCEVRAVPVRGGVTDMSALDEALAACPNTAAVCAQQPNYFGCIEDMFALCERTHEAGALFVAAVNPISLGLLVPPGEYGADVAVAEGQPLGCRMSFGGPLLGIFTCRQEHLRRMPGRIVGATTDVHGNRAYCMTLQTREQHIRRERATSNICTNEALLALTSAVYLSLMGKAGLRRVAELCVQKAHYAAERIAGLPGYALAFGAPFFNEFVVETPVAADRIVHELAREGVLPGRDLGLDFPGMEKRLLVCVTERRTRSEIDRLVDALSRFSAS